MTHSDWAAPLVAMPKGDGQIRLYGDYKVTVNKDLEIDQYPLPRPDELFAALFGGVKFSKIDLTLTKVFSGIPAYHLALCQLQKFFNARWRPFCSD